MNQRRRLESVAVLLSPEEVPTACFFATDRHQAESGFGGVTALEIFESVEEVDRTIRVFDELRGSQRLDLIDTAIVIQQQAFPHYAQTPSSIAGSIVQAFFHWDKERYGEDRAWRQQRSPGQFEGQVAARLVGSAAS
jgi:hypothetical protein